METQYISLNMTPTGVNPCFHISQYDVGRMLGFIVHSGGATVDLDTYTCTIEATRSDGTAITSAVATTDNIGTFEVTPTMSSKADKYRCQLIIVDENSKRIASLPFDMEVTKAAMDENSEAIEEDASLYQQYTEAVQGAIAEANADIQAEENARIAAVNAEATARQNADATLQNNIDAEATARQTADNTLQGNINSEASARASADSNLQSQINQIVAPSGEAPSAAEVQNARIGADGVTYDTLGTAIRSQVNDIHELYNPVSDLDNRKDVDLFISDSYGNVLVTFKDGEFITKEFNTVKSYANNICDTLEDCDLAISDSYGNVVFCIDNGDIITSRYDTKKQHYSTFSILGDSYSTFKGYTEPLNNLQWYPPSDSATQGSENDVENVENTWWYLFANEYKSLLIQNNSYSGSCISYDSYGDGTIDGKNYSFVKRCENLKKAELIIIEGGTNDAWANVALGEYKYSNWVESDFETFRPACSYVLDYIKRNNIGAKIIFILNDGLKSSITESIKNICNHYNVDVLELSNIKKSNNHPNIEGMKQIKEQLINFLLRR